MGGSVPRHLPQAPLFLSVWGRLLGLGATVLEAFLTVWPFAEHPETSKFGKSVIF